MVAAELTETAVIASDASRVVRPRAGAHARRIAATYAALWALTALGTLIGRLLPSLGPGGRPHPSLHGSLADLAAIAATNARVLSAPFLLALFRFPSGRRSRQLGDLLIVALLTGNALLVGLAVGRHGDQLLPYLPQLPLEWLAAAVAGGAWLALRMGARTRTAIVYAVAVLAVVGVAAAIETLATPRAAPPARAVQANSPIGALHPLVASLMREVGGGLPAPDRASAPALASRSLRSLPLAVARFRSAVWPALPGYVNHPRIPQRRDQE